MAGFIRGATLGRVTGGATGGVVSGCGVFSETGGLFRGGSTGSVCSTAGGTGAIDAAGAGLFGSGRFFRASSSLRSLSAFSPGARSVRGATEGDGLNDTGGVGRGLVVGGIDPSGDGDNTGIAGVAVGAATGVGEGDASGGEVGLGVIDGDCLTLGVGVAVAAMVALGRAVGATVETGAGVAVAARAGVAVGAAVGLTTGAFPASVGFTNFFGGAFGGGVASARILARARSAAERSEIDVHPLSTVTSDTLSLMFRGRRNPGTFRNCGTITSSSSPRIVAERSSAFVSERRR